MRARCDESEMCRAAACAAILCSLLTTRPRVVLSFEPPSRRADGVRSLGMQIFDLGVAVKRHYSNSVMDKEKQQGVLGPTQTLSCQLRPSANRPALHVRTVALDWPYSQVPSPLEHPPLPRHAHHCRRPAAPVHSAKRSRSHGSAAQRADRRPPAGPVPLGASGGAWKGTARCSTALHRAAGQPLSGELHDRDGDAAVGP